MRTAVAILTALLLGAHALLGCCWHHGSHCEAAEHSADCCVEPHSQSACCNADHCSFASEQSGPSNGPDLCHESSCVYTHSSGPTIAQLTDFGASQPLALCTLAADNSNCLALHDLSGGLPLEPPLRLHLLKGLLRI